MMVWTDKGDSYQTLFITTTLATIYICRVTANFYLFLLYNNTSYWASATTTYFLYNKKYGATTTTLGLLQLLLLYNNILGFLPKLQQLELYDNSNDLHLKILSTQQQHKLNIICVYSSTSTCLYFYAFYLRTLLLYNNMGPSSGCFYSTTTRVYSSTSILLYFYAFSKSMNISTLQQHEPSS